MNRSQFTAYRKNLIVAQLKNARTANQAIERIFASDMKKGPTFVISSRGWKFYVHLNKLFAPLEREGRIKQIGECDGEKLWVIASGNSKHLVGE